MVLRSLHLEPGQTVQIPVSDGKKFVQAKIESQRREDLNTAFGMRKTIRYEVFLFDNILYKRSGHLHVWLTDDNVRLPVQLQVRLQFTIGTITFKLAKDDKF
jgi:antitoxin component of MazEF toxin-antitoxin module